MESGDRYAAKCLLVDDVRMNLERMPDDGQSKEDALPPSSGNPAGQRSTRTSIW